MSRLRWMRFSDRMKGVLQVMTALVGVAAAAGLGWMAWSASQERGLAIAPFSVPPDFAARGLSGQVMASMVLDRVGEMQEATGSVRSPSTYANNWNDEIKVEIPETGVSIGELQRLFVQWLGHQTTISGALYRTADGIAVAARTVTAPAKPHAGKEQDLDDLVRQAAEDIYASTQPYRWSVYVGHKLGDNARAQRLQEALAQNGDRTDRIWAFAGLNISLQNQGLFGPAVQAGTNAIALDPNFPLGWSNRGGGLLQIGHDEAGLGDNRKAAELSHRYGRRYFSVSSLELLTAQADAIVASSLGDNAAAIPLWRKVAATPGQEPYVTSVFYGLVESYDFGAARQIRPNLSPAPEGASAVDLATSRFDQGYYDLWFAYRRQDWRGAAAGYAQALAAAPAAQPFDPVQLRTFATPLAAAALAHAGDASRAWALVSTTPLDCYLCLRKRGEVLAQAGDRQGADRWFAEAVRQGPSLPYAYAEWGRALLDRGQTGAAIAKLELAHQKSPRYPDALELWGEALTHTRDFAGAAAKYAEADRYAPNWGRNHLRWGEALLLSGHLSEARAQFRAAQALEMPASDQAALGVYLDRTSRGPLSR
jgi:tetratricopeptide (TPR) repeat protein